MVGLKVELWVVEMVGCSDEIRAAEMDPLRVE